MKRTIVTVIVVLLVLGGLGLLVVYSGGYDVAATDRDPAVVEWVLETTAERSIERRAKDIVVPAIGTTGTADLREGAEEFVENCEVCHGGPGVDRSSIGKGLNPLPPDLAQEEGEWTSAELFWIAKNGIRMTGMPAFGPTHDDEELWAVTRFVEGLPRVTAAEYRELREEVEEVEEAEGGEGGERGEEAEHQ